jgi:antibiotic biosynthesis monooxygenase (ABM) superfamily enzyme
VSEFRLLEQQPRRSRIAAKSHVRLSARCTRALVIYSPEYCRRCGMVAQQRAAQATDLTLKEAFKDVARHWLALAERVAWLDRQDSVPGESAHKNE